MRRIGIYGGSFNPPHLGHVLAARNARALLQLGEILFIPAAIPPHKAVAGGSPDGETRLALTELAIAGETGMSVSRIELDRPGPSYTVDTLRALRESYGQDELFLLMGTDMFLSFFQWREPEAIAKLATPVCMARVRADAALSAALQQQSQAVETAFGIRPIVLQNECLEISSTEARRLLFFGIADGLLHPDVLAKIEREKLYGVGSDYRGLPFEDLRRVSLSLHKEKRRAHTQGVSDTAVQLAQKYGADTQLAARAATLASGAAMGALKTATSLPTALLFLVLTLLGAFYLSRDREQALGWLRRMLPEKALAPLRRMRAGVGKCVVCQVRATIMLLFIIFIELTLGFCLMRIEYAVALAALIAAADALPVIGAGLFLLPAAAHGFLTGSLLRGIGFAALYAVTAVTRQLMEPKLIGRQLGLHPLSTMTAMYAGLRAMGFAGMLLGPLLLLVCKVTLTADPAQRAAFEQPLEPILRRRGGESSGSQKN